ncbi:hypothetical protein ABTZ03_42380 [Kitasatospora sp. NPDC096077]|uniref:hypothetical protein n=1 Tax=Kitasatospora sp. NPDC096077 TaxID=3155544 RepID=UPI003320F9FC
MRRIINPRESVRRKATGMTREQITEATQEAAMWERHRSRVCDNADDEAMIKDAIARHKEWRRIGYVMAEEHLTTYDPDRDPTVQRWNREARARELAEAAAQAQAAERAHQEQQPAPDTAPKTKPLLTALARAGLHPTETDHHTVGQLTHLDHDTITRIATWIEAAHDNALRRAASAPAPRPPWRRPQAL